MGRSSPKGKLNNTGKRRMVLAAKQDMVDLVHGGMSVEDALQEVGRHRSTYDRWRKCDPDFAGLMDEVRTGRPSRAGIPDFPEFCRTFLKQPLSWHQLQWVDLLEGRKPRQLHPSQ